LNITHIAASLEQAASSDWTSRHIAVVEHQAHDEFNTHEAHDINIEHTSLLLDTDVTVTTAVSVRSLLTDVDMEFNIDESVLDVNDGANDVASI